MEAAVIIVRRRLTELGMKRMAAAFCVCVCAACAHFPRTAICTTVIAGPCSGTSGYRVHRIGDLISVNDSTLVILSFSGGGTRAAAFAYGVLRGLDSITVPSGGGASLLDHVTLISGVSGGAFTAAHFATFGRRGFSEFEKNFLFDENLWKRLLLGYIAKPQPQKWFSGTYSRSDYVIEQWDRLLFHGKTFADLETTKTSPFLLINATDLDDLSPFPFVQERFDLFCADMSRLTVARAVGASSAFPGLLAPVTLEMFGSAHGRPCGEPGTLAGGTAGGHQWLAQVIKGASGAAKSPIAPCGTDVLLANGIVNESAESYIHLIDGGAADNLGICVVLRGLESEQSLVPLRDLIEQRQVRRLVVILVDAGTRTMPPGAHEKSPGFVEVVSSVAGQRIQSLTDSVEKDFRKDAPERIAAATRVPSLRSYFVMLTLHECARNQADAVNLIPTTFGLPRRQVSQVISLGENCVKNDPQVNRFLREYAQPGEIAAKGTENCPLPVSASIDTSLITAPIYFDFDKSTISADAAATLKRKIPWLECNPRMRIRIAGFADPRGSDEYDLGLGQRRAASAKRFLVRHGVAQDRFDLVSYGEERPVCTVLEEVCWQENRRADFQILLPPGERIVAPRYVNAK